MKNIIVIICCFVFINNLEAQNVTHLIWRSNYNTRTANDNIYNMGVNNMGTNFIVNKFTPLESGLVGFATNGTNIFNQTEIDTCNAVGCNYIYNVIKSLSNNNFLLAGINEYNNTLQAINYNNAGTIIWKKKYGSNYFGKTHASCINNHEDFVVATHVNMDSNTTAKLHLNILKINSTLGDALWQYTFIDTNNTTPNFVDVAESITTDDSNNIYTLYIHKNTTNQSKDVRLLKLNDSGQIIFNTQINSGLMIYGLESNGKIFYSDSALYVLFYNGTNTIVKKLDDTLGAEIWSKTILKDSAQTNFVNADFYNNCIYIGTNTSYVTLNGSGQPQQTIKVPMMSKLDTTGNLVWQKQYYIPNASAQNNGIGGMIDFKRSGNTFSFINNVFKNSNKIFTFINDIDSNGTANWNDSTEILIPTNTLLTTLNDGSKFVAFDNIAGANIVSVVEKYTTATHFPLQISTTKIEQLQVYYEANCTTIAMPTADNYTYEILSTNGQVVAKNNFESKFLKLEHSNFNTGMYILKIKTSDKIFIGKIIMP
jgi:Secretion system C-terminal sorting domain